MEKKVFGSYLNVLSKDLIFVNQHVRSDPHTPEDVKRLLDRINLALEALKGCVRISFAKTDLELINHICNRFKSCNLCWLNQYQDKTKHPMNEVRCLVKDFPPGHLDTDLIHERLNDYRRCRPV